MATTKKRTNSKSSTGRKSSSAKNARKADVNDNGLWDEVVLILLLAFSLLLVLSNFHLVGSFGDLVSDILFGIFGIMAYAAPVLLFLAVCFVIANKGSILATVKIWAIAAQFMIVCVFFQMISLKDYEAKGLSSPFSYAREFHKGGGWLGGTVAGFLHGAVGSAGTYLILIVLTIICMVIITEKSFIGGVKKRGAIAIERTKEDSARRRELREERMKERERLLREKEEQEKERQLRMDRRVSGVAPDTTIAKPERKKSDEIREITFEDLTPQDFDFENIQIKMADSFAADAKVEAEYELPKPEDIQRDMQEEQIALQALTELAELPPEAGAAPAKKEPEVFPLHNVTFRGEGLGGDSDAKPDNVVSFERKKPAALAPDLSGRNEPRQAGPAGAEPADTVKDQEQAVQLPVKAAEKPARQYVFPPVGLLTPGPGANPGSKKELQETAMKLQQTLANFGVKVTMTEISQGPTVTRYEMQPEQGVKVSKIVNLADDIKLNLAATDIRIEAPIPGKAAIGIEVPNKNNAMVSFRELIDNDRFSSFPSDLAFAVGKDISGEVVVTDIAKMPHLLIAGATGSGKSVCINTLIMSIIYKASPDDVKMIMVDPKVVELSVYNGIPHLMVPVVTDPKKAAAALQWGVNEMDDRYRKFAEYNVRNLKGYNKKIEDMKLPDGVERPKKLPQIVIIVDELADLMMVAPGDVEASICRLAQLARAAGIYLIIATQRPSVDVITGLIKANMPSRIAFSVSSGVDSRTILDMNGAEKLLGKGDMLFYPQGYTRPARVQGAFVSDKEVQDVVDFLKDKCGGEGYSPEVEEKIASAGTSSSGADGVPGDDRDAYFVDAAKFIIEKDKASIGMLQRVFKIGFNRAARIMDQLADAGVVGEEEGTKPRKVLMSEEQFEQYIEEYL